MDSRVIVTTGARLHFGLIVEDTTQGRAYSGLGAMVAEPGFQLSMERLDNATADEIDAPSSLQPRIADVLSRCRIDHASAPVRVIIERSIPEHIGLGSGTQLAYAVGSAFASLFHCDDALQAIDLGRGRRSAIGRLGFRIGGMIAHGLHSDETLGLRLTYRAAIPTEWRFVLFTPSGAAGLHGPSETAAFGTMPSIPAERVERLHRLILDSWWPALLRADFDTFAQALYEYGQRVGEYFAACQGGVFAHPQMATLAEHLRQRGASGVAQTSWGPTIAVLCRDDDAARDVAAAIAKDARWSDCVRRIVAPLNHGALQASGGGVSPPGD